MSRTIGDWRARPWGSPWEAMPQIVAAAQAITEIGLHRGMCFGPCPVYTLHLRRSGEARFLGEDFVDLMGPHEAEFALEDFSVLALAICHIGFETLDAHYAVGYTDAATTTTWINRGGRRIEVEDYGGAGPYRLRVVEDLIDAAASELHWRPAGKQVGAVDDRPLFAGLDTREDWRPPTPRGGRAHWTQRG